MPAATYRRSSRDANPKRRIRIWRAGCVLKCRIQDGQYPSPGSLSTAVPSVPSVTRNMLG